MNVPLDEPQDPELVRLVSALCDERLDEADRLKLEERLRSDPEALRYCSSRIQFESELGEVINPSKDLEWTETRSLLKSGEKGWELRLERSLFFKSRNRSRAERIRDAVKSRWWWVGIPLFAAGTGIGWWTLGNRSSVPTDTPTSPLVVENGDFEAYQFDFSKATETDAILGWSDYFPPESTTVVNVARNSEMKVSAHSGQNVARLRETGFLTQKLVRKDGTPWVARPGAKLRVSGWAHLDGGAKNVTFTLSLRFVASGYPEMFQYEPVLNRVVVSKPGWQYFSEVLVLPDNLTTSMVTKATSLHFPAAIDVTNKGLTLSVDNRVRSGGTILLDDLYFEELDRGRDPVVAH